MGKNLFKKLILPVMLLSSVTPITSMTSCGFREVAFRFENEVVYLPLNMTEDLTQFMEIDNSILAREILWSSSDTDSIKINSAGLAKGIRPTPQGQSVVITATLYGNSISCRAIVGEFSFNTNMIVLKEDSAQANIYESYLKSNSANISRYTTLSVEDENVAKVDTEGNIIPVAEGLTKIFAQSRGGTTISTYLCVERKILDNFTLTSTTDEQSYIISNFNPGTENFEEVTLPRYKEGKEIKYLGECFKNNNTLKKIVVPDTYTKIVARTFINNCDNVESLILPDTIEDVKDYFFTDCTKLTEKINSQSNIKKGFKYLKSSYPNDDDVKGAKYTYLVGVDFDTMGETAIVEKDCRVLAHRAFSAEALGDQMDRFSSVSSLSFYQDCELTCISDEEFTGNTHFTNLSFPDTVKYIYNSFKNIGVLNSFKVPNSLEYIGTNWLDGTTVDTQTLPCFTTLGDLIYMGSTENKFLILYGLVEKRGGVTTASAGGTKFEVTLQPTCRIIGANAFQIHSTDSNWNQHNVNGLSRINKPQNNQYDKTNRLFSGTVSAEETSITCICGNAFKDCDYIDNLVLSAFTKYFDITGLGSSGINNVFCESVNQPMGFDFSGEPETAQSKVLYQSVSYKTGNFWHYNTNSVPTRWDDEEE